MDPIYQVIADALGDCLGAGLYKLSLTQDGHPVDEPVLRLARILDRNGLINRAALKGTHRDHV